MQCLVPTHAGQPTAATLDSTPCSGPMKIDRIEHDSCFLREHAHSMRMTELAGVVAAMRPRVPRGIHLFRWPWVE